MANNLFPFSLSPLPRRHGVRVTVCVNDSRPLKTLQPNQTVTLKVQRDGDLKSMSLMLGERPNICPLTTALTNRGASACTASSSTCTILTLQALRGDTSPLRAWRSEYASSGIAQSSVGHSTIPQITWSAHYLLAQAIQVVSSCQTASGEPGIVVPPTLHESVAPDCAQVTFRLVQPREAWQWRCQMVA